MKKHKFNYKVGEKYVDTEGDWWTVIQADADGRATVRYSNYYGTDYYDGTVDSLGIVVLGSAVYQLRPKPTGHLVLKSMTVGIVFLPDGSIQAGCQHISKRDALKLFKVLGKHLGYDVEN